MRNISKTLVSPLRDNLQVNGFTQSEVALILYNYFFEKMIGAN
jgi:hypothetical protein